MRLLGHRLLIFLTVGIGGGSLALFAYFLLFGVPFAIEITPSDAARLAWNSLLCVLFFLQHSGMIRRSAKERMAKRVPVIYYPAVYSIASGTALFALILLWQPTSEFLFCLHGPARWVSVCLSVLALAGFAWGVHALPGFDPFGTLPLKAHWRGTSPPAAAFVARGPYRYVRHPLYLFMLLLIWSTPRLSTDRLLFIVLWTAWIVVGTTLEERDLFVDFGESYRQYQCSVPMLIPVPRFLRRHPQSDAATGTPK
jgi:protein-S-isoprenylcysteine O-methyltransferase Ste14